VWPVKFPIAKENLVLAKDVSAGDKPAVGDKVTVEIFGKDREGTVKKIHSSGDMADVDFGKGDVYGITFSRMKSASQDVSAAMDMTDWKPHERWDGLVGLRAGTEIYIDGKVIGIAVADGLAKKRGRQIQLRVQDVGGGTNEVFLGPEDIRALARM